MLINFVNVFGEFARSRVLGMKNKKASRMKVEVAAKNRRDRERVTEIERSKKAQPNHG